MLSSRQKRNNRKGKHGRAYFAGLSVSDDNWDSDDDVPLSNIEIHEDDIPLPKINVGEEDIPLSKVMKK